MTPVKASGGKARIEGSSKVSFICDFTSVFANRLEPFPVDARILILVLDLPAALLHGNGAAAFGALAPERNERIAPASEAAGEVARRLVAGIEMLMEHPERRRVHEAVLPGKFLEFRFALVPQQRIALAVHRMHMGAGGVTVRLLVAAGGNLRAVGVHRSVGKNETDIRRAFAARLEFVELEAGQVVNEVRLPDVSDPLGHGGGVGAVIALALEMLRQPGAIRK